MKSFISLAFLLFVAFACAKHHPVKNNKWYTVTSEEGNLYTIQNGKDESGIAWCYFSNDINTTGWSTLNIQTNPAFSDDIQMYAAGYLEGFLTSDLIWANYYNMYTAEWNGAQFPQTVQDWLDKNIQYMNSSAEANPHDPYWVHVSLVWKQLMGMIDGYAHANNDPDKAMPLINFLTLNMDGDLEDLLPALNVSAGPTAELNWNDDDSIAMYHTKTMHCSALVKVSDDLSEIYTGHTTWTGFYEMTRIFKTYNFSLSASNTASRVVMFSGYPAMLSSVDDFYVLDTGLVVTETTNGVMNFSLYEAVTSSSVLSWIRVMVANRMAASGSDWVSVFSLQNSGTYNNQWIIVDNNKLDKGVRLNAGALYILEQIPGYIYAADVTQTLARGYWSSFNVPSDSYVYNVSGFPQFADKYGAFFLYENNPRAEIFRRDSDTVQDITAMQKIMRYNDYQKDPLEEKSPAYAISARFDLCPKKGPIPFLVRDPSGGIDSKVTSTKLAMSMMCYGQSGPTHDDQPPFEFSGEWDELPHLALPEKWNFDWELFQAVEQ